MTDKHSAPDGERRDEVQLINKLERYAELEPAPKPPEHQYDLFLAIISIFVALLIANAVHTILPGTGTEHFLQVIGYGLFAGLISFLGNKISVRKGTLLAARGDTLAIVFVVGWFTIFGSMAGTLGFTGMAYKIVREAVLRDAGQAVAKAEKNVNHLSIRAKRVVPAIEAGKGDISAIVSCEITSGCVSGRAGVGSEVAKLQQIVGKYKLLLDQYRAGDRKRVRLASKLNRLAQSYERTLNSSHENWGEKRAALLSIYLKAQRVVIEIENAIPTVAAKGFVSQLRALETSSAKPGRVDVAVRLASNADQLEEALGGVQQVSIALDPFPQPPGIAAGWQKLELTWPLAVLAYLLEVAVLYLWFSIYREYMALRDWLKRRDALRIDRDRGDGMKVISPPRDPEGPNGSGGSVAKRVPTLDSDPVDGPHGWSGRSRFNGSKLDGDES